VITYAHLLGTKSDADIAAEFGITRSAVSRARRTLRIARYAPAPFERDVRSDWAQILENYKYCGAKDTCEKFGVDKGVLFRKLKDLKKRQGGKDATRHQ
jgi:hypothetical protein